MESLYQKSQQCSRTDFGAQSFQKQRQLSLGFLPLLLSLEQLSKVSPEGSHLDICLQQQQLTMCDESPVTLQAI